MTTKSQVENDTHTTQCSYTYDMLTLTVICNAIWQIEINNKSQVVNDTHTTQCSYQRVGGQWCIISLSLCLPKCTILFLK